MNLHAAPAKPSTLRIPQGSRERRLHRRVPWSTRVRGLTEDGVEFEARTVDVCAGGIRINVEHDLRVGESLVLYLDEIGRVEGSVIRPLEEYGYAIALRAPPRKRDKIADQLTWLINRDRLNLEEDRVAERRTASGHMVVTFGKGITIEGEVVDMSIFGVALRTAGPRPMLGETVAVGGRKGACVRFFEGGFAVDFRTNLDEPQAN